MASLSTSLPENRASYSAMQLACGFLYRGGGVVTTTPAKNLLRSRDTCTSVGFPSEMDGQTNQIRRGSRMKCVCVCVWRTEGGGESQWLETDIFSNKNRERDTQQNRPLSDIIMSKREKTGAGTHVALRIPWAIHLPTIYRLSIFTYTGCGSGLLFWQ